MGTLRGRRLPAGAGREAVKREQRELLFAAMVTCCERRGYEATSVADLLEASGLSRGTFYANFDGKLGCFTAAEAEMARMTVEPIERRLRGEGHWEARARSAFELFVEILVAQPAAARMCMVESYAAGEAGVAPIRNAVEHIVALSRESLERRPGGSGMPVELARAIVGGFYLLTHSRVHSHREKELPELVPALWEWAMSYRPPPGPLRSSGRRPNREGVGRMPPFAAFNPEQRIIRAFAAVVAEKGYPSTTIADVCAKGSISQTTFYQHFADKPDVLRAALDSSGAQMYAAAMPSARRAPDWPNAVRAAIEASCGFLAAEPDFARLRMVEVYSGGPSAIEVRDESGRQLIGGLLQPALAEQPDLSPVVIEATIDALYSVFYERVREGRAGRLQEAAPLLTYVVLSPLLGNEPAYEIATSRAAASKAG